MRRDPGLASQPLNRPPAAEGEISLIGLTKRFGDALAVDGIDLEIPAGEFFSLLGPSGCGKTTTLRMIAGFEQPDPGAGAARRRRTWRRRPPKRRNVDTVFQSYALFPHLKVFDNVAFGLRRRRRREGRGQARVGEVLELVQLTELRRAAARPALGRAAAAGRAGAGARAAGRRCCCSTSRSARSTRSCARQLQVELKQLQEQVGITFVYVTHDQEEALTMSDQIAVMTAGRVEQVASPRDLRGAGDRVRGGLPRRLEPDGGDRRRAFRAGSCQIRLGTFALDAARGATSALGATAS